MKIQWKASLGGNAHLLSFKFPRDQGLHMNQAGEVYFYGVFTIKVRRVLLKPTIGKIESQLIQTWLSYFQNLLRRGKYIFYSCDVHLKPEYEHKDMHDQKKCSKQVRTPPPKKTWRSLQDFIPQKPPRDPAKLLRVAWPSPGCWFIMDVMENPGIQVCYP